MQVYTMYMIQETPAGKLTYIEPITLMGILEEVRTKYKLQLGQEQKKKSTPGGEVEKCLGLKTLYLYQPLLSRNLLL